MASLQFLQFVDTILGKWMVLVERIIQFHEKKIRQIEKSDLPEA